MHRHCTNSESQNVGFKYWRFLPNLQSELNQKNKRNYCSFLWLLYVSCIFLKADQSNPCCNRPELDYCVSNLWLAKICLSIGNE
jgi:hypothetical protein